VGRPVGHGCRASRVYTRLSDRDRVHVPAKADSSSECGAVTRSETCGTIVVIIAIVIVTFIVILFVVIVVIMIVTHAIHRWRSK